MSALKLAFDIISGANRAMSATDVKARLPFPHSNPRVLTTELRAMGKIAEVFRLRNERFFLPVPGATAPEVPTDGRTANEAVAARRVRRKQRLAMLARKAKRKGLG